jgi:hypothetical protein
MVVNMIGMWLTCVANLERDTAVEDPIWLKNRSLDLYQLYEALNKILEDLIDGFKDRDIEQYQSLRDVYRQDTIALRLREEDNNKGVEINGLILTPNCYLKYTESLPPVDLPQEIWATLYTNWGKSVAACMDGNPERGIKINPPRANGTLEELAAGLVAYHEGCFHLQKLEWKKAIEPLKLAQTGIKRSSQWQTEIDTLCEKQLDIMEDVEEKINFCQFWYKILDSQLSRKYLLGASQLCKVYLTRP